MLDSIFLHIPKTAGTSVKPLFQQEYSCQFIEETNGKKWLDYKHRPGQIRHISGHVTLSEVRENVAVAEEFSKYGRFLLTFVRDPLQRVVSDYYYIRSVRGHPRAHQASQTLAAYVEERGANAQSKWLAISNISDREGLHFDSDDDGNFLPKLILLDTASVNETLPVVWKAAFNRDVQVPTLNRRSLFSRASGAISRILKPGSSMDRLSPDLIDAFYKKNELDTALVRYARKKGLQAALDLLSLSTTRN